VNVRSARPYCDISDRPLGRCFKGEWRLASKYEKVDRDLVYDHCKIEPFNANSGRHIASSLTRLYGWEPVDYTPTGQPKTDAESLAYVAAEMPLAAALTEFAEANKVLTSFISPFIELQTNGTLRANFNQTVTMTGRLSSSQPRHNWAV
jgi:DNA polymerase I-like protein with 3'-5' exonuclease and polymerase domains